MKKMKTNILVRMHTQKTIILYCLLALSTSLFAQQLPDSSFENWGNSFNGDPQLVNWNGSNVTQSGFQFYVYVSRRRTDKRILCSCS